MSDPARRDSGLDALRGLAVLGMVLSGSLAFGGALPAWMFHAQVPPPLHKFVPTLPGIGWVDLVFPFFLFSLGAALPLALRGRTAAGVASVAVRRFGLLVFFALFTQQMKPAVMAAEPGVAERLWALAAFAVLGGLLTPGPAWRRGAAGALALAMLAGLPLNRGEGFAWARSDIILLVLAHMALWASLLWVATREQPLARWAVLLPLAGVLLGGQAPGSWNAALLAASPVPALFQVHFLKYLFIVVPGMAVGEWLAARPDPHAQPRWLALPAAGLVVINTVLLFEHSAAGLRLNLLLNLAVLAAVAWGLRGAEPFCRRVFGLGAWLLLSGLALEALQGGIKKDSATFSYFFVTSGLACFALLALRRAPLWLQGFCALHGRNPLLAYVAGALVVAPLLQLSGLYPLWAGLDQSAAQGLAKGLLFTGAVAGLTWACSRRGWLWKS